MILFIISFVKGFAYLSDSFFVTSLFILFVKIFWGVYSFVKPKFLHFFLQTFGAAEYKSEVRIVDLIKFISKLKNGSSYEMNQFFNFEFEFLNSLSWIWIKTFISDSNSVYKKKTSEKNVGVNIWVKKGGSQHFEQSNVERPIFQNFEIPNIKRTKDELFDFFILDLKFFYICLNYSNSQNIWLFIKLEI